jgi:hypothetical protein
MHVTPLLQAILDNPEFVRWCEGLPVFLPGEEPNFRRGFVTVAYHGTFVEGIESFRGGYDTTREDDDAEGDEVIGSSGDPNTYLGAHFTLDPTVADLFAGVGSPPRWLKMRHDALRRQGSYGSVYPVFIKVRNPKWMVESELTVLCFSQDMPSTHDYMVDAELQAWAEIHDLSEDTAFLRYEQDRGFRAGVNAGVVQVVTDSEDGLLEREAILEHLGTQAKQVLLDEGHDGVVYYNEVEGGHAVIVFDPSQVKSWFNTGRFDPEVPDIRANTTHPYSRSPMPHRHNAPPTVLDPQGHDPLRLYRADDEQGMLEAFHHSADYRFGHGYYFTPDPEVAGAPRDEGPFHLTMENPLVIDADEHPEDDIPVETRRAVNYKHLHAIVEEVANEGVHDGVIVTNVRLDDGDLTDVYIVFDEAQAVLADG